MKRSLILLLVLPLTLLAQSPVERLITELDSLTLTSYNDWRVSPDLKSWRPAGDPAQPGFDDSAWETLRLDQSIYPDSCWLRKTIALPVKVLGQPVRGAVRFSLSVDDYGYLWINGMPRGRFDWDGDFELTADAAPGQTFVIAVKAVNTGGPLRIIRAEVRADQTKELRSVVEDVSLSLRAGEKLLSFDTYQTNATRRTDPGTDKTTIPRDERMRLRGVLYGSLPLIDVKALAEGPPSAFFASIDRWKSAVEPVGRFARQFTLQFTANAHIDAAWLWRSIETIEVCRHTFNSACNILDARPDVTYAQSSAAYYRWMEEFAPDVFERMRAKIKEGRWEITGGMWVEPDCNIPAGDSWLRHLLYAKRYFKQTFGVDVTLGWNPDSFGYNANMPMFYSSAGINAFITQKIGWNETNVFPYRVFWWESPDGSRILSVFPFDYVNDVSRPFGLVDWTRQFEANTGFRKLIVLFGIGNHGGGPSLEMMKRIDRLKTLPIFPSVEFGTAGSYVDWLRAQDLASIPVWKDELYLEYHQGTFTTQAAMKRFNRESENLLTGAETFASIAARSGAAYPADALRTAWEKVLFNQFHDILPGSGIREVYIDATKTHQEAQEIGTWERNRAIGHLASRVNTGSLPPGEPVVLFNQLAWDRDEVARVELKAGDTAAVSVFDARGREVPSQMERIDRYRSAILFRAQVPSLGYASYVFRAGSRGTAPRTDLSASSSSIENDRLRVAIDPATGWLTSVFDKRSGKELLSGPGGELQLLEDKPRAWDAWNVGLTGVKYPLTFTGATVVERGPVRATVRLTYTFLRPGVTKDFPTENFPSSFFTQDVSLTSGSDMVDFTTTADWWEEKTMLKVAFPVTVQAATATYEIPFGTVERSTGNTTPVEKAQYEVPAERWADVSADGYGVSLINRSKYGYDIKGSTMRLSLLRSPKWPDPTADRGMHVMTYALAPHSGDWRQGNTEQRAIGFNSPLIAAFPGRHRGTEPLARRYVGLDGTGVVLAHIKTAEQGTDWVVTLYNTGRTSQTATLTLADKPKAAWLSNVMEEKGPAVATNGLKVTVPVSARGMAIVRVSF